MRRSGPCLLRQATEAAHTRMVQEGGALSTGLAQQLQLLQPGGCAAAAAISPPPPAAAAAAWHWGGAGSLWAAFASRSKCAWRASVRACKPCDHRRPSTSAVYHSQRHAHAANKRVAEETQGADDEDEGFSTRPYARWGGAHLHACGQAVIMPHAHVCHSTRSHARTRASMHAYTEHTCTHARTHARAG